MYTIPFHLPFLEHAALAAVSALGTNRTHCHLCPIRYSFTPESSEACEGEVPFPRSQHRNNIERREKLYYSENPAPSGIRNRATGSDMAKLRATSLSVWLFKKKKVFTCLPLAICLL